METNDKHEAVSKNVPSALGEENALKGYTAQYIAAAEIIYSSLNNPHFEHILLKDPRVGSADDLVLVFKNSVDAYQIKWSNPSSTLTYSNLTGSTNDPDSGLIAQLGNAWQLLVENFPDKQINIYLYTSNIASNSNIAGIDESANGPRTLSEFINTYWESDHPDIDVITKWTPIIDKFKAVSKLSEDEFSQFRTALKFQLNRRRPEEREEYTPEKRYYNDIDDLHKELLTLAGRKRGTIELDKISILNLMKWDRRFEFVSKHEFPITKYYEPIERTVDQLKLALRKFNQGYVALIGSPGSGKSTLLTNTLRYSNTIQVFRYYCFIPDDTALTQRGEAYSFIHDLVLNLKAQGIHTRNSIIGETIEQLRLELGAQIQELGTLYQEKKIRTLILIDGLDHIKREGQPERSLLVELPRPNSIPDGVVFVLGSQSIENLELKYEITHQLTENDSERVLEMAELPRRSIRKITCSALEKLTFEEDELNKIEQLSSGHPLALSYIINRLRHTQPANISEVLSDLAPFQENIERQYELYWQELEDDIELKRLLALLSRMRGFLDIEIIRQLANDKTIKMLVSNARHYFQEVTDNQWRFFHNSFRQFVLDRTGRNPFGIDDLELHRQYHNELATLAAKQETKLIFKWELLYHTYHARKIDNVIKIAQQKYFREQFFASRSLKPILEDLMLVIKAAKEKNDALAVIRVLLVQEELTSRYDLLEDIDFPEFLLSLNKLQEALSHVIYQGQLITRPYKALNICMTLLKLGNFEIAKEVFNVAEPLGELTGINRSMVSYAGENLLHVWVRAAIHFHNIDELIEIIKKIESQEPARDEKQKKKLSKQLRNDLFIELVDEIILLGDREQIENLPILLGDFLVPDSLHRYITINLLDAPNITESWRNDCLKYLLDQKQLNKLKDYQKIVLAEILITEKNNLPDSNRIFQTIEPPKPIDEQNNTFDYDNFDYLMNCFRYYRLQSTFDNSIDPEEKVPDPKKDFMWRYVLLTRSMIQIANVWGEAWRGNIYTADEAVQKLEPTILLYERSHYTPDKYNLHYAFSGFTSVYFQTLISAVAEHGESAIYKLFETFENIWKDPTREMYWSINIRRSILKDFHSVGLSDEYYIEKLCELDDLDEKLSNKDRIRDFLDNCQEKAKNWAELQDDSKPQYYLDKIIRTSFGIQHEKDTQIYHWVKLFIDFFNKNQDIVANDLKDVVLGVSTCAAFNRGRESNEAAMLLLEAVLLNNPTCAKELVQYYWQNDVLEFIPTIQAIVIASAKSPEIPFDMTIELYTNICLPYERWLNNNVIEALGRRLSQITNRESAKQILDTLIYNIEINKSPDLHGKWWRAFEQVFEREFGQEDLLIQIRDKLKNQKLKLDHTPGYITLIDGEKINEEALIERTKDVDQLIYILENIKDDKFYHWTEVLSPLLTSLDYEKSRRIIDALLCMEKGGELVCDLLKLLEKLNKPEDVEAYAQKLLSSSKSSGWGNYYDGGTRIEPYKILVNIDDKYRSSALVQLIDDLLQGYRPHHFYFIINDIIPLLWKNPPYESLWPEIKNHFFQLREFADPPLDEPEKVSLTRENNIDIIDFVIEQFFKALTLPSPELREDGFKGVINTYRDVPLVRSQIENKIHELLINDLESPLFGIALISSLHLIDSDILERSEDRLNLLLVNNDIAIRLAAAKLLSDDINISQIRIDRELPSIYSLILPDSGSYQDNISKEDVSVFADSEDPREITSLLRTSFIFIHEETGIPYINLAQRTATLMKELIPQDQWDSRAENNLQLKLRKLRIETYYRRPRAFAALTALGHLLAELYDSRIIDLEFLNFLHPAISVYDKVLAKIKPNTTNLLPFKTTLPKDIMGNNAEWLKTEPTLPSSPPLLDDSSIAIGFIMESEGTSWEIPKEILIGSISSSEIEKDKLRTRPELIIPGTSFSLWWRPDQYPNMPFLDVALQTSIFIMGTPQRVEIGRSSWIALNPIIGEELNWSFSNDGLFRWTDQSGEIMVESYRWQRGRIERFAPTDGTCSQGWIVKASQKGYSTLCKFVKNTIWICRIQKEYAEKKEEKQKKSWCNFHSTT